MKVQRGSQADAEDERERRSSGVPSGTGMLRSPAGTGAWAHVCIYDDDDDDDDDDVEDDDDNNDDDDNGDNGEDDDSVCDDDYMDNSGNSWNVPLRRDWRIINQVDSMAIRDDEKEDNDHLKNIIGGVHGNGI